VNAPLKAMAMDMNSEIGNQNKQLDRMNDKVLLCSVNFFLSCQEFEFEM
jgi:hypothetical protein